MNISRSFKQAWDILLGKEVAMKEVMSSKEAMKEAWIFIVLGALGGILGTWMMVTPFEVGGFLTYRLSFGDAVWDLVVRVLSMAAFLYLSGAVAVQLFHSKADASSFFKVGGFASVVIALGFFPMLFLVAAPWFIWVYYKIFNHLGKLDVAQVILVFIISFIGISILSSLLGGLTGWHGAYEMRSMMRWY